MALDDSNKNYADEFEPDFEVTEVPVESLPAIGIDTVEKVPEIGETQTVIKLKTKQEGARSVFAIIFLVGFLTLLTLGMVLGFFIEGDQIDNIREIMLAVSGILSGPLGFVVGYYFRRSEE